MSRRILITGGTGSLGQALVAHWLKTTDDRLIVLSRSEYAQAQMREVFPDARLDFFLGDVRDLPRLQLAFAASIDVVVHAAALKRVDSVCHDPDEVIKTNVLGARNVLHAARGQVARCLLVSSDKACYPANAYGLTKAMGEHLFTAFNVYGVPQGTRSASVRYGNVLHSRGSVIPLWRQQIAEGLPVTITDPTCSRFLLTFPQAIAMIETALAEMEGGEIFVPRLPAARLDALARAVCAPDWPVRVVGLRPGGEKRHETLLTEEESLRARHVNPGLVCIVPELHPWREDWPSTGARSIPGAVWRSDTAFTLPPEALRELVGA